MVTSNPTPKSFSARVLCASTLALVSVLAAPASAQMTPWGWSMADIGAPSLPGNASFGATIAMTSAGMDVNGTSDQFTFVYRTIDGDATIVARVNSLQNVSAGAQAGLMVRDSLAPGGRHAFVLTTPTAVSMRSRAVEGGTTEAVAGAAGAPPIWLKLERRGGAMIASRSADGLNWLLVGSAAVSASQTVYVGLAAASNKAGASASAQFSSVAVVGNGALPAGWTGSDLGSPTVYGGSTSNGSLFILDSAGSGITGGVDQARYVYQQVSGDRDLVARVTGFENAPVTALAGVMMRQSLTGSSAHAAMLVSAAGSTVMRARSSSGALSTSTASTGSAPRFVRVQRRGGILITAQSADGITWTTVGQQNVPLADPYYVGIAVTGGDAVNRARATFDRVEVSLPNTNPTVNITNPSAASTSFTAPLTLTVSATASDADGIAQVEFYAGTKLIGTDNTSPFAVNWSSVPSGTYVLKAIARDNKGGSTTSTERTVVVTASSPPLVSLNTPANGVTVSSATQIYIAASASDFDGSVARVEFYAGATRLGSDTSAPYAYYWNNAPAGSYELKAVAIDNTGMSTTSNSRFITVQANALPVVSITQPAVGATIVPNSSVVVTASATDSDGTVARVDFWVNSTLLASDTTSPYSASWPNIPAGPYVLKAVAVDNLGGVTTSATQNITVAANRAPSVSLSQPSNGATFAPGTITIAANASDSDGSVARVEFFAGATRIGTATTSPYTVAWASAPVGSYVLKAVAFDDAGLLTESATRSITVSNNTAPTVSIGQPASGASVAPGAVVITANASDSDGSIVRVEFYNGSTLLGTDTASPFSVSWPDVAVGSYTVRAVAFDNSGASTTSSNRTFTVSTNQAPTVTMSSPSNGQTFMEGTTIVLAATASDTDGTVSRVEFYNGATLLGSDSTSPYTLSWTSAQVGTHGITAVARDNGGAMTVSSARDITVTSAGVPKSVVFSPSAEHEAVDRYVLEVYASGTYPGVDLPVAIRNLGRPGIVNGEITQDVAAFMEGLASGSYIATVSAENAEGTGRSQWTYFSR